MRTRVKICGITRLEDAQLAVDLGAAALGFNFYPPSPRYISPDSARRMILKLPPLFTAVGIFANEADPEHVAGVAAAAGVTAIQLHGPAFPHLDGVLRNFRWIPAIAVTETFRSESLRELSGGTFLLDSYDPNQPGGTGKTFNWALARQASQYGTIILAGGLTPENVGPAIQEVRPFAVDVASGVESDPGRKDPSKLRAFFRAVAKADEAMED